MADTWRSAADGLSAGLCEVLECRASETPENADMYVWDADSGSPLPESMARQAAPTKLVLVSRSRATSVRQSLPSDDFVFLHTPLTSVTTRVVLEVTIARRGLINSSWPSKDHLFSRDRILQKLFATNLHVQEFDHDRTNFLIRAVNDIRVPLTTVHGYCGLLLAGQLGSTNLEQTRILTKMQRSLQRLAGLATSLLDLGAAELSSNGLHLQRASIQACLDQAVQEVLPLADQKQIQLDVELEPPAFSLLFDPNKLEQVFVNLLDNACKFTPKYGSVEVAGYCLGTDRRKREGCEGFPSGYRIDISDNGLSISPAHLQEMFDEYTSSGRLGDRSGAGLGLAISRKIIDAHAGRIWASSDGRGARFSVVLPYSQNHVEHLPAVRFGTT